jgi:hypothetical protein
VLPGRVIDRNGVPQLPRVHVFFVCVANVLLCVCCYSNCYSYSSMQGHDGYQYSDHFSKQHQHQQQHLQQHLKQQQPAAVASKLRSSHEQHAPVDQYPLYMTAAQHDEYSSAADYARSQRQHQQHLQQQQQWNGSASMSSVPAPSTSILKGVTRHQEGLILADASTAAGAPPARQQQQQNRNSGSVSSGSSRMPWTAPNSYDDSYGQVSCAI